MKEVSIELKGNHTLENFLSVNAELLCAIFVIKDEIADFFKDNSSIDFYNENWQQFESKLESLKPGLSSAYAILHNWSDDQLVQGIEISFEAWNNEKLEELSRSYRMTSSLNLSKIQNHFYYSGEWRILYLLCEILRKLLNIK